MKTAFRLLVLGATAVGILILGISLASGGQQAAPVKKVEPPAKALAASVLRKLTAPTSREVILESIKSLPRPAASLKTSAGTASPMVKLQMRRVPGQGKPAAGTGSSGTTLTAGTGPGYETIDWNAGVFISPFSAPTYGASSWAVASMTVYNVGWLKTENPGVAFLFWREQGNGTNYLYYNMLDVKLELPPTAGIYTVTLKINRIDGACLDSWVRPRSDGGPAPLVVTLGNNPQPIPMAKLLDDSGFVGIVNLQPQSPWDGSAYGMRVANAELFVTATPKQGEGSAELGALAFGGLIITRLQ